MERILKKIAAILLSATLAAGLVPAAALAAGPGAATGSAGTFGQDGTAKTDVYVVAQDTRFRIVDHAKTVDETGLASGIWVQVGNAVGTPGAKWFSQKVAQNDGAVEGAPVQEWAGGIYDAAKQAFYLPVGAHQLDVGGTYHFWAEVTDPGQPAGSQTDSNADDPILVVNSRDFWAGPLEWSAAEGDPWTWQVAGGAYDDAGQSVNGADGRLHKDASLSAFPLADGDRGWAAVETAAADRKLGPVAAWTLNVADVEGAAAFAGTLAVTLDLTEALGDGAADPDLQLLWLDPYATGDKAVVLEADHGFALTTRDDGHVVASFVYDQAQAGQSGYLGTFAVVAPRADVAYCTVTISAGEGGRVSDTKLVRPAGSTPSFFLFQDAGYTIDGVYTQAGQPAPGTLAGNRFTLDALAGDLALVAQFAKIPDSQIPDPGTVTHRLTVRLDAVVDAGTSVSVVGAAGAATQGKPLIVPVDGASAPLLHLSATGASAPDKAVLTMGGADTAYAGLGEYLELPLLTDDATVVVTFKATGGGDGVRYAASASAVPAAAAEVSADPALVAATSATTFKADVAPGYELVEVAVTEGGRTRIYAPAELAGTTLTIYNVLSDAHAEFRFRLLSKAITVPNLTQFQHVAAISPNGTQAVDAAHPLSFAITVEAGFDLPTGSLWLQDAAGNRVPLEWTGTPAEGADLASTFTVPVTFADVAGLGEGIRLMVQPQPTDPADQTGKPTVRPGPPEGADGQLKTKVLTPTVRPGFAIDGIVVDGVTVLDDNGELKDAADLAARGYDYDAATGTYWVREGGARTDKGFRIDPSTYAVTIINTDAYDPRVSWPTTPARAVSIEVSVEGGTLVVNGVPYQTGTVIQQKTKQGLDLLMTPNAGWHVKSLRIARDAEEFQEVAGDIRQATDEEAARAGQRTASTVVRTLSGAQPAFADGGAPFIYTITSPYLDSAKRSVRAVLAFEKDAGSTPGGDSSSGSSGSGGSGSGNSTLVNDGDTVGDGSPANADGTFNIKASVKGGHGKVEGEAVRRVKPGEDCTVGFTPDPGYQVASLTIDGTTHATAQRSLTFKNVRAGHTVEVAFEPVPYAGDNSTAAKTLRKLKALAATGDLAGPALFALLAVAFGAGGAALLVASRRRARHARA